VRALRPVAVAVQVASCLVSVGRVSVGSPMVRPLGNVVRKLLLKSWPGTPLPAKAPLLYVQKSPFLKPCSTGATVTKSTALLAELARKKLVPRKSAMSGYEPAATLGVIVQEAVPLLLVVPVHVWPASAKCSVALGTTARGETEISTSVAVSGSGV